MDGVALDLVLIMDTTGSMGTHLRELRRHALELVGEVCRAGRDVRLGMVAFKDHGAEGEDSSYLVRTLPLSPFRSRLVEFLHSPALAPGQGGGGAEAVECALRQANRLGWRPDARRIAILIGDRPPHGGGLDDFAACPCGVDYRDEVEGLARRGVALHAIRIGDQLETRRVFEFLAARTGGSCLQLPHVRDLPSAVASICHHEAGDLAAYRRRLQADGQLTAGRREMIHRLAG